MEEGEGGKGLEEKGEGGRKRGNEQEKEGVMLSETVHHKHRVIFKADTLYKDYDKRQVEELHVVRKAGEGKEGMD